jgi:hypothetical protein
MYININMETNHIKKQIKQKIYVIITSKLASQLSTWSKKFWTTNYHI